MPTMAAVTWKLKTNPGEPDYSVLNHEGKDHGGCSGKIATEATFITAV